MSNTSRAWYPSRARQCRLPSLSMPLTDLPLNVLARRNYYGLSPLIRWSFDRSASSRPGPISGHVR